MKNSLSPLPEPSEPWVLDRPWRDLVVTAEQDGIVLPQRPPRVGKTVTQPESRLGRLLPSLLPVLEEAGITVQSGGAFTIPYSSSETIASLGLDIFDDLVPWAPFALFIEGLQFLGSEDFRYRYGFFLGQDRIALERRGWFVRRGAQVLRLDPVTFRVVEAMDRWNAGTGDRSDPLQGLLSFAEVKSLAEGVGAQLDAHLLCQNVIVPPRVGVDLVREPGDRISFVPRIQGVPESSFRKEFLATDAPEGPFSVSDEAGRQYQIIFDKDLGEVVRRMWRVRHVGGAEAEAILHDPAAVFDGVLAHVDPELTHPDLDLTPYSARVVGIGPLLLEPSSRQIGTGVLGGERVSIPLTVRCASGASLELQVSYQDLEALRDGLEDAECTGKKVIPFGGAEILADSDLRQDVERLVARRGRKSPAAPEPAPKASMALLIQDNLETQDYEVASRPPLSSASAVRLPRALSWADGLKPHQELGVSWLLDNLRSGMPGCLLADDMGLGKTLQVLTFLAAAIEDDERMEAEGKREESLICVGPDSAQPPYHPILIIAPVILLENQTWQKDMRKFFANEGGIFLPMVDLRGPELKRHHREGSTGQETVTGQSILDVERLQQYRVVLTNYETVVNYQFSFGQVPWSIVITDEAQAYKTPGTRVAHAVKALKATFRVAATGTPVETSLEDVWSIFDFLEPSSEMLGTLGSFRRAWVRPVSAELAEGRVADLAPLRKKLGVCEPGGRVLRREKSDHVSLPPKREVVLPCLLSEEQVQQHLVVLERARTGGPDNHPLALINQLLLLTQHSRLVPAYNGGEPQELAASCPKLTVVLEELEKVRQKGEKALIFTRSIPMQQILCDVFHWRFGLTVGIINGRSGTGGEPGSSRNVRQKTLERFQASNGFDLLILSPEVAGLGLTIVEANHVFHYGRWWNPAKELQATDRAYRIGQQKEVFVYYPVARDPEERFKSIDQSLDDLLRRRKDLAREFLMPGSEDGQNLADLTGDLFAGSKGEATPSPVLGEADLARMDGYAFEALVSAMERKKGHRTILTPAAGDEGIDVLSLESGVIWLLQCKHNRSGIAIDHDALDDLRRGHDGWRGRHLGPHGALTFRMGLIASGPVTKQLRREAREEGIEVWDGSAVRDRLKNLRVTHAELQSASAVRADSMKTVQTRIAQLLAV